MGEHFRLFIAEKPSMAEEIAKCLPGPMARKNGCFETAGGIVTWLYGHILRMAEPGEYEERFAKWNAADLPIIPNDWILCVSKDCEKQFAVIKGLVARASEIIHAGDPDREGQLLVDEVLEFIGNKKPVLRLLLNALDEKSVRKALGDLRDNKQFAGLKASALARQRADWMIGMNLSRAYTLAAQSVGHQVTFPIGRVKTPTLALVVRREREISKFTPVEHYGFRGTFNHANGEFTAVWKAQDIQAGLDPEGRLIDRNIAGDLKKRLESGSESALVTVFETKERTQAQPLPYSLSALQVAAGRDFGYSPQLVLETAQSLYEKKLTTYPRSDCDYLPESQFTDAARILSNLCDPAQEELASWALKANSVIRSKAWNDGKITAHHAIIPTMEFCDLKKLSEAERNIYGLIARVYIAQFYPVHEFLQTNVLLKYLNEDFKASGRVVTVAGWKELFSSDQEDEPKSEDDSGIIPAMKVNDLAAFVALKSLKKTTKPPERFTEGSLLKAMKEIHRFVKNDELKKQLKNVSGIGTEATRAGIIEDLVNRKFLLVDKKKLVPTETAFALVDVLPDELTYPDTTALWEDKLKEMEIEEAGFGEFLSMQSNFVKNLCFTASTVTVGMPKGVTCPACNVGVLCQRTGKKGVFWGCSRYRENCTVIISDKNGKPDIAGYKLKSKFGKKV